MKNPPEPSKPLDLPKGHWLEAFNQPGEITEEQLLIYEAIHAREIRHCAEQKIKAYETHLETLKTRLKYKTTHQQALQWTEPDYTLEDLLQAQNGELDATYRRTTGPHVHYEVRLDENEEDGQPERSIRLSQLENLLGQSIPITLAQFTTYETHP
ncbi:MAG TPA: hypothetical protein VJG90_07155 [Candidatus Nanoarchaeia archaeon]|nr:hypothetical protein [Candidatus Nanoarchaeia archaeon]